MSSLRGNIILNYINTFTGIIFPVITFPYSSRILLPEGIGTVNFLQSIINYIVLFTSLGIPMYAIREVAKHRDDIVIRNKTTLEIGVLSLLLSVLGYIPVFLLGLYIPQINENISIFFILSLTILFNCIGVNWFYQAIEEFKFITIRSVIFRVFSALSLFIFVKDKSDLLIYASITVVSTVGSNIINFIHLRKYINICDLKLKTLSIFKHLKPAVHIFVLNLVISIYVNLNSVMLGFMQGEESVGYYSAGVRISHILLSVVTSIGSVMIPRCSNLISSGKLKEFSDIVIKSCKLVICLSLPFAIGISLLANQVINIFCGEDFINSVSVLHWTSPIIIFIGITNVIGIQILYPQNKENIVIWSTVGGALFNLILNILLIPLYAEVGAAIATFIAELSVLVIQILIGRRYIPFKLSDLRISNYIIGSFIMTIVCLFILTITPNIYSQIGLSVLFGGIVYILYLLYRKEELVLTILRMAVKEA